LMIEVVPVGEDGPEAAGVLVHNETNHVIATMLAAMDDDHLPVAVGVIYCNPGDSYGDGVAAMKAVAHEKSDGISLDELMHQGHTWTVD